MARVGIRDRQLRIAIAVMTEYGFGRSIIRGASQACLEHGVWLMWFDPVHRPLPEIGRWRIDGVVATVTDGAFVGAVKRWDVPVVNVSSRLEVAEIPQVSPDNVKVGRLAAEHLEENKSAVFASLTLENALFGRERLRGFVEGLSGLGKECALFVANPGGVAKLVEFVKASPKPVGLFGMSDSYCVYAMRELADAGVRVPEDVQVVGVDNDDILCMSTDPPLTTVNCDYEGVGIRAVEVLLEWLRSGRRPGNRMVLPVLGVMERFSSRGRVTGDGLVDEALRVMREELSQRLSVKGLADRLGVSRRTLELRFMGAMKSSPAVEIVRAQVDRAKQLLVDTQLPLDRVAAASGLGYQRQLRSVFQRHVGISPQGYRRKFQVGQGGGRRKKLG